METVSGFSLNQEMQRRHKVVADTIKWSIGLKASIDRGEIKLAPTDIPFTVRAWPFRRAMQLWEPNPRNVEKEFLLQALDPQPGQRGIEGGSGEGFLTEDLVKATSNAVLATDPSSFQVGFLLDSAAEWGLPYEGLVHPLTLSPDSPAFLSHCRGNGYVGRSDYVTGLAFWHHVPNQQAMIENFAQVLKMGGVVVGADVLKGSRLWLMFTQFLPQYVIGGHEGTYIDRKVIEEWCLGTPFEIEEIMDQVMKWQPFEGAEDMGAFVGGLHGLNLSFDQVAKNVQKYLDFGYDEATGQDTLYWDRLIRFKLRKVREWTPS